MFARDSLGGPRAGTYLDLAERTQFISSVDNNQLAVGKPGFYGCVTPLGHTDLDRTHIGGVVGLDYVHEGALRTALDSDSRHHDLPLLYIDQQPGVYKLVGEQSVLLVVEDGFEFRCAGCRVDLVVER